EDDRPHADEGSVADRASVHDSIVTDGDVLADHDRMSAVDVNRHVVLHIAAASERDAGGVGTQHSVVPDTRTRLERDVADDTGTVCDKGIVCDARGLVLEGEDGC